LSAGGASEPANTTAADSLAGEVAVLQAEDILFGVTKVEGATESIAVKMKDGTQHVISVGPEKDGKHQVKISGKDQVFIISAEAKEGLFPAVDMMKKPAPPTPEAPAGVPEPPAAAAPGEATVTPAPAPVVAPVEPAAVPLPAPAAPTVPPTVTITPAPETPVAGTPAPAPEPSAPKVEAVTAPPDAATVKQAEPAPAPAPAPAPTP